MKKLYSIIMMLAIMVAALSFTACGGDDDDDGVVGTWFGYECSNDKDLQTNHTLTLVFNANGTGKYDERGYECSFSYIMEDNTKGKAFISSRGTYSYFVIEGGKMYVYGHGYGYDLDFLLTKQ